MVSPVKEVGPSARAARDTAESTIAELRESITAMAKDVADIAERRTRAARQTAVDTAGAGASELRRSIRRQPVAGMAVAAAAGASLALLIVPRVGARAAAASRWESWTPNVTRADLYDLADNISRSVSRAAQSGTTSMTPAFERLADALSRVDSGSSMSSLLDRANGWFQKAQDKAKEKMG